jgi:hypothetical protein
MAFNASLTINDSSAAAKTFSLFSQLGTSSDRIWEGSTVNDPLIMQIRHNFVPKKGSNDAYDRHVVLFKNTIIDSDDFAHMITGSFALNVPRVVDFVRADIDDIIAYNTNFLVSSANIDRFLRNES